MDDAAPGPGEPGERYCDGPAGCGYVFLHEQERWVFNPEIRRDELPEPFDIYDQGV